MLPRRLRPAAAKPRIGRRRDTGPKAPLADRVSTVDSTVDHIALVLRFDSEPIDKDSRTAVIKGVNRNVVFQRNRDLTDIILERVNH